MKNFANQSLELCVFYAPWSAYYTALTAAAAAVSKRDDITLHARDALSISCDDAIKPPVKCFPCVRLYRNGQLLGESCVAMWTAASMTKWLDERIAHKLA